MFNTSRGISRRGGELPPQHPASLSIQGISPDVAAGRPLPAGGRSLAGGAGGGGPGPGNYPGGGGAAEALFGVPDGPARGGGRGQVPRGRLGAWLGGGKGPHDPGARALEQERRGAS